METIYTVNVYTQNGRFLLNAGDKNREKSSLAEAVEYVDCYIRRKSKLASRADIDKEIIGDDGNPIEELWDIVWSWSVRRDGEYDPSDPMLYAKDQT